MPVHPDLTDLLSELNGENVEYLVVGAHAVMVYTEPRFTKDLDVWVRPSPENAERVHRALAKFGAPLIDCTPATFTDPQMIYQIGVAPVRVDVLMGIAGIEFEEAWPRRHECSYGNVPIHVIGKQDLIRAKRAAGRPQDLIDVQWLEASEREQEGSNE